MITQNGGHLNKTTQVYDSQPGRTEWQQLSDLQFQWHLRNLTLPHPKRQSWFTWRLGPRWPPQHRLHVLLSKFPQAIAQVGHKKNPKIKQKKDKLTVFPGKKPSFHKHLVSSEGMTGPQTRNLRRYDWMSGISYYRSIKVETQYMSL